jgi:hypothetical protein
MTLLAKLMAQQAQGFATATVATNATVITFSLPSVATVAEVAVANKSKDNPDRYCWPNSPAMNTLEIKTFHSRVVRFSGRAAAEQLADRLVRRDREGDDREMCIECLHMKGMICHNSTEAGMHPMLGENFVDQLQRCAGFSNFLPF